VVSPGRPELGRFGQPGCPRWLRRGLHCGPRTDARYGPTQQFPTVDVPSVHNVQPESPLSAPEPLPDPESAPLLEPESLLGPESAPLLEPEPLPDPESAPLLEPEPLPDPEPEASPLSPE
jgi:hypothetical protein